MPVSIALDPKADRAGVLALETVFETPTIYDVVVGARRIELVENRLETPLVQLHPIGDAFASWAPWDTAWVAEVDGAVNGFAAVEYEAWHSRRSSGTSTTLLVHRGHGIARQLMARVEEHGRARGATHVWLETSNVNVPGIAAYERLGYAMCGSDVLFYQDLPYADERALYFAKKL